MWHKAEYCGKRAHNIRMAISAFENTVRIYYALNDYNKVMQISDSASSAYLNSGYKDKAARAIFIQIDIYLKRGDIKMQRHVYINMKNMEISFHLPGM